MIPSHSDLIDAHQRIQPFVHRTPTLTSETINRITGAEFFFKCENFQRIGAFKIRGATNALLQLSESDRSRGVVTHSSGNHAQAVALAAARLGIPAWIVMPSNAPAVKVNAVRDYGAKVTLCEPTLAARDEAANKIMASEGAVFIPSYNHPHIVAGQATAAMELLEDLDQAPDLVMAPVGGGGLLSGTALAVHYLSPETRVIAGEPANADDAARSLKAGRLIPSVNPDTIADGLLTSLGDLTFEIIQKHVAEIVTVSEAEIIDAMRLVWERMKIVIEPSSAVPLAAAMSGRMEVKGKRIGLIFSGGNVDLGALPF